MTSERPLNIVRREDLVPLCPHCEEALPEVYVRAKGVGFVVGRNIMFFCPHCSKVLGFAQSRMI